MVVAGAFGVGWVGWGVKKKCGGAGWLGEDGRPRARRRKGHGRRSDNNDNKSSSNTNPLKNRKEA